MYLVDPKNKLAVSEMIGFQPEKIVIAGDSAGANLVFSLICCLNEIKRNYPEYANLKMPSSIVCVYGRKTNKKTALENLLTHFFFQFYRSIRYSGSDESKQIHFSFRSDSASRKYYGDDW